MATLQLRVLTQERTVVSKEVEYVKLPGKDGSFGIMSGHAPLMAPLEMGIVEFGPREGKKRKVALGGGFVEMRDNQLTVLARTAELDEEIDVLRAREAKERAERRLAESRDEIDYHRARLALQRALLRLKVAEPER
ncbi:MAG: F0F1 ATP synthase subunit epsilon [Firmicutes bacterium]|jgi:F-type H+-transporting ATPase subunit epsilon|nr:F0F1 ATP synthase subunit epsilon [Bacillota bacterium]NLO65160.1 F0F1 ATP synthase subunit epsilon [Bacillota bacterium]